MSKPSEFMPTESIVAETVRFAIRRHFPDPPINLSNLEVRQWADREMGTMVVDFIGSFLAGQIKEEQFAEKAEEYPINWWHQFKMQHFPKSWLKRWPVKTFTITRLTVVKQYHMCPHIAKPTVDHFVFLGGGEVGKPWRASGGE